MTSDDATRLVDFLPTLPHSATKRYKGLSLVVAAKAEGKLETKRLIHPETVEDYHAALSAMLSYAVDRKWLKENPLKGRIIRERLQRVRRRDRQILTPDEMTKVFSSLEFQSQRSGTRAARFWIPLLCLFHGTRSNEVAGLHVADIEDADGFAFLNLRENLEHRLKNMSSARRVPVHQKLVTLGFLDFVAKRREEDPMGYLFTVRASFQAPTGSSIACAGRSGW